MKCPKCGFPESRVVDSRPTDEGGCIRRRRECLNCQHRFTTYERIEEIPIMVIKKDGSRQTFDRAKLLNGIVRACEKRPVPFSEMEKLAGEIESTLAGALQPEVPSNRIGEMVMEGLKKIDEVAYVRFASVYREFKDINTFMDELESLLKQKKSASSKKKGD
jgi:transcriptional repressor NrdR